MNYFKGRPRAPNLFAFVVFLTGIAILASAPGAKQIQAQSGGTWSEPVNLSQSGSASAPALVVDSEGTFHAVWSDEFADNQYASGDGADWTQPVAATLPFGEAVSELLADKDGIIHAFWLESSGGNSLESTSSLHYSAARAADLAYSSAWTPPVQLAESAVTFDMALDPNGDIHLLYLRSKDSPEFPAGVYYLKLVKSEAGWAWSSPALLYSSPYFRSLKLEDASVDIAASSFGGAVYVYAAWDNRSRERVYLASSADGGQTWGSPKEIDKPDSALGYDSTGKILVEAYEQEVLLVWQRSSTGGACSHYYQRSKDGGDTWSQPGEVSSGSSGCSQEDQLLSDGNGLVYLWTIPQSQVTLLAWDGRRWSNPQVQNELSTFIDPETQNLVIYDCRQPVLDGSQQLAVVGCDTGGGGDIWFTMRKLDDAARWFSAQTAWSEAEEFASSQFEIGAPALIAAPDGGLLALWSQVDPAAGNADRAAIHAARWDRESWTASGPIIQSSQGSLTQPSAVIDGEGRVLAVWSASEDGKLYMSWANANNAQNPSEWAEPVQLPVPQALARSSQILVNDAGEVEFVYSVPVNEGRGVYLIRSEDGGESWSSPVRIFDAAIANWQMVDNPRFMATPDGALHVLWSQREITDGGRLLGLRYARSEDDGNTWSEPEAVTDGEVTWSQMLALDQGTLLRAWQEGSQIQSVIRYQFSQDGGLKWSPAESLGSFGEKPFLADLVTTSAGDLHLLQMVQASSGSPSLRDWLWQEGRWSVNEFVSLTDELVEEADSMVSNSLTDGTLAVIFSAKGMTRPGSPDHYGLFFAKRAFGEPLAVKPTEPTAAESTTTSTNSRVPAPTGISAFTPSPGTPEVQTTPTLEPSTNVSIDSPPSSSSSFLSVGRGVFLSALIIVAAVIIGIRRMRSNR